ncbi:MAG: C1 family peptidase [Crocinitomicaceae bacterium]|nr:C1 family peptidase [Crocinitomicaceae bacterium]
MKKIIHSIFSIVIAIGFSSQLIYSQTVTNAEGSEYKFSKVVHLDATPVLSQGNTGTCWSFSALSYFESEMIRKGVKDPDILSEMFIVRKAYESKADKYIRMDGKTNFSQGGAFHDIPFVVKKYGIVPQDVYKGLNYGSKTHNHNELFNLLEGIVKGALASSSKPPLSSTWKTAFNAILDTYLGADIKEFEWKGKKYTPQSYAKSIGLNMDDYVSVTSFTNHEMNKPCMLEIQDNWAWGTGYNVSIDDLYAIAVDALKNGYTLAWGADVSEKGFSFSNGLGIVPEDPSTIKVKGRDNSNFSDGGAERTSDAFKTPVKELTITQELRQEGYDNKTTTDDHGMHIVGLYKDQNGTNYFLVKNSWGTGNYPQGFLYVSENYFKYKTINIYLHKDGLSKDMKKKLAIN